MGSETPGGGPLVYIDADPFSWTWFAGIPRYAVRLALALAARGPVRFFHHDLEIVPPAGLDWSQDQDLARWAKQVWKGRRRPLGRPPAGSLGLYCGTRSERRRFPFEAGVLHDFCPLVVPWTLTEGARRAFGRFLAVDLLASDLVLAVSHSTRADAAWLSPLDPDRIVVAHSGPSLCVGRHFHRRPVRRENHIALAVSTVEPRKNAGFLIDWFHQTKVLPPELELWWVGRMGWLTSRRQLRRLERPPGGRRVRFLGQVSDARLCELYQSASWSIYPSLYEGFGFPVLDSLRHGTPVLTSFHSSLREFTHPGVFFFDPHDPATVDLAYDQFRASGPIEIPLAELNVRYSWDNVARTLLGAYGRWASGETCRMDQAA